MTDTNTDTDPGLNLPAVLKDDPTAAERQRRCRQRKSVTNAPVTRDDDRYDRDAQPVTEWSDGVTVLCAKQDEISISFDDDGDAIIKQTHWPDEDQIIIVSRGNLESFLDKLCDAFGIPSFGRP